MLGQAALRMAARATEARSYRFLRIVVPAFWGDFTAVFTTVRWLVGTTEHPMDMTANNVPPPLLASASNNGGAAWQAFHSSTSNYWYSNRAEPPDWLQLDLGAGLGVAPTGCSILVRYAATRHPTALRFLGSDSGAFAGEEHTFLYVTGLGADWFPHDSTTGGAPRLFTW